jgi:PAS domain S-box-containing protein
LRLEQRRSWLIGAIQWVALAAVYVLAAKIGFTAAFVAEQVSPVWPPTGIAVWAGLFFGARIWPVIWIGAFIANATTNVPLWVAAGIATGNSLEAVVAVWLLRRFGGVDQTLDGLRHVASFLIAAAVVSTAISASVGVTTLCIAELQPWSRFGLLWWVWWLGDATGAVLVAPALLTIPLWRRARFSTARVAEAVALAVATIVLSLFVFAVPILPVVANHPLEYIAFPLVIWAGLRFAHPGAALVSAGISGIAVWGALHGTGPFSNSDVASLHESVILLQIYMAVLATSGLVFGAAIADRHRAERLRMADHAITAILSDDHDLRVAARRLLRAVCKTLDWDVGILWRTNDMQQVLEYVDSWRRDRHFNPFVAGSRIREFKRGIGLPGRVWSSGRPEWIYDVIKDANFPRRVIAKQTDLHGGFAFPILSGDRVRGVMEFFTREPRKVDRSLLTLMAAAGSQIGQFIDRRHAQQRVTESEALNSAVVSAALDCIITIDASGRILEFNPAAVRTFGYTRDQALGTELAELLVPAHLRERHREALRRCVESGETRILGTRLEMPALRSDGTEFPIELAITQVGLADRTVFTAHLRDIADRRRIEEERSELLTREHAARLQAENANRTKDLFLTTVSHELRTPLTAILGWASMLRTGHFDPARLPQIYDSVYRNAEVQVQIVNDLLDVSRMVAGQVRLDPRPTDACEIARLSVETVRPAAMAKGVTLRVNMPPAPQIISGDPARLQQVVWNLLSNATKFTGAGGEVTVSVYDSDSGRLAIEVTDTGTGIPAALLPRVFERFFQADSTTTRAHGGLGLGLAIVRHLVELHGGEVQAASEGEGRGSTFRVLLPMAVDPLVAPEPSPPSLHFEPRVPDLIGLTALVVDDDAATRELFSTVLQTHGATVVSAASAMQGFEIIERQPLHVLIIDIGMPGEDGLMLLRRIRARESAEALPQTPAIAVTAYAGVLNREEALRAGFVAHVPKPVLPHELVAAIVQAAGLPAKRPLLRAP